jgi:hypothetical protein
MWWTPEGERASQGHEAALFREALGTIVDMVHDDDERLWQSSAPPFDDLRPNQKLALLAQVGKAILRSNVPTPALTAISEAAVGAVYETIRLAVEMEIGQPAEWRLSPTWRELVLAACRERGIKDLLEAASVDLDEWEVLVGCLADAVLWDEDWKETGHLLDADPTASRAVKKLLRIDEDYYVGQRPISSPKPVRLDGYGSRR